MFAKRLPYFVLLISFSVLTLTLFISLLSVAAAPTGACNIPGDQPTIQAAIGDVTCNTINLTDPVYVENVVVTRSVTIQGQGALSTTVDGNGLGNVFVIEPSRVVTLTDLTITNGSANFGGGIDNFLATLTLINSTLISNTADFGGGIFSDGLLTLNNSTLISNTAVNDGGGIGNFGTLSLTNSSLSGNTADFGGGIYNGSTLSLTNSSLSGNMADFGGGIFSDGTLTLNNSTLISNEAVNNNGGGVFNDVFGTLSLTNSTLSGNTAGDTGGGIWNGGNSTLTNSNLSSDSAVNNGGGIGNFGTVTLNNSSLSNNTAVNLNGGGIFNDGTLTMTNSTLSGNMADFGRGGGIINFSIVTLSNSTLSGNTADFGGGIDNDVFGTLSLTNSTLSGNTASIGGGIGNRGMLTLNNSLVANSLSGGDCDGGITSLGYNLDSDNTCNLTATGDITNTNPLLGPLQDNGGDTFTHALLPGSPAIDQIPVGVNGCGTSVTTDQRGVGRPQGAACDIGSFEVEGVSNLNATNDSPTVLGQATTLSATVQGGESISYTWAFGDGEMGSGPVVTHTYPAAGMYTATVTATNSVSQETATTMVIITEADFPIYLPFVIKE